MTQVCWTIYSLWVPLDRLHRGDNQTSVDIANYIYDNPTALDLDLQGIWMADRKLVRPEFNASLTLAS